MPKLQLPGIFRRREDYSLDKLSEFKRRVAADAPLTPFGDRLAIFTAGSYARNEASPHSDIDLFFIYNSGCDSIDDRRTAELRLFGRLIEIADVMGFPRFSNDSRYLETHDADQVLRHLGSPTDDHKNYFTLRMLMLLEGKCVYGDSAFEEILMRFINSYYRDYPDHQATFEPTFLINDVARFWKTLLLNYEHRRNQETERAKVKQKVRNFKLKFSRMTTCFATIAAVGTKNPPVDAAVVREIVDLTPRERLEYVARQKPDASGAVQTVLKSYAWFLSMTALPADELEANFTDKQRRREMFGPANEYRDHMLDLLAAVDQGPGNSTRGLVKTLAI